MKSELLIITQNFPFFAGEHFLRDEMEIHLKTWDAVSVFCVENKVLTKSELYPKLKVLPNGFKYIGNERLSTLFSFMKDLLREFSLLRSKGLFRRVYKNTISEFFKCYELAKWMKKNFVVKGVNYVVYSYWGNDMATTAAILSKIAPNVKSVCRVHGFDVFENQTAHNHVFFREFQLKHLSKIYSVSKSGASHILKQFPKYANKIGYSHLGVKESGINEIIASENIMISCAFVRPKKGVLRIVDVLKHVKLPLKWVHIGDGESLNEVKEGAIMLPSFVKCEFLGNLTTTEILAYYRNNPVNLFISLSESEGLPVSMMESISFGIPVFSTDVGGCGEIVNEETGELFPLNIGNSILAGKIDSFWTSKKNKKEYRSKVRKYWIDNFRSDKNFGEFSSELKEISIG